MCPQSSLLTGLVGTFRKEVRFDIYFINYTLMSKTVKNLPAMQETWVRSLGWEDPLEKGVATHSSVIAWEIP